MLGSAGIETHFQFHLAKEYRMQTRKDLILAGVLAVSLVAGCGDSAEDNNGTNNAGNNGGGEFQVPETYSFDSRFVEGESSVSYSGQTMRQVLISDLNSYISGLSDAIDGASFEPTANGDVVAALDFYFRFDSDANGSTEILVETDPGAAQMTYDDISSGKDLIGKLAGNDTVTDHKDWSTEFAGWSDTAIAANGGSADTPEGLVTAFFGTIEVNALGRAAGDVRTGSDGENLPVYVTEQGHDLKQLTQKFLLMAVTFSQGTDDYLDDATDGKGLLSDNADSDDGSAHSSLEHQWDEGFGYFGAARDYLAYTDEEIAGKGGRNGWSSGYYDTDDDGAIDLLSEYNFGNSTNAAKRDRGASDDAATDFTAEAMTGFLSGRALITAADGPLGDEQMAELKGYRDTAVLAWESAVAATVVHYINDTLQAMATFGSDDYSFTGHAKVWSEMKGFSLGFQFNPRSPVSDGDFEQFHTLVGDAPVLSDAAQADIDQYKADLVEARQILGDAYGFADANLGDDNGENGW
jgi:hypothetical protein